VIGHREAPGRPALYATTTQFLDDLGLASLEQLPALELTGSDQAEALAQVAQASLLDEETVQEPGAADPQVAAAAEESPGVPVPELDAGHEPASEPAPPAPESEATDKVQSDA
jgi:segregation and condensation protein B